MVAARDKKGRFLPGHNIPGPGRATRSREENLIGVLADVCTPDKWEKICARAVRDSIRGDDKARRWVSSYLIGLPRQILELQSNEVLILAQVLAHFKVIGLEPSDVFQAMLASESEVIEVQSDE